jgi:hypothetical protein
VYAIWIFNITIFICHFDSQKTTFVCEFQHIPLWKIICFSIFHVYQSSTFPVRMRFCRQVPNSTRNKNLKSHNPYLLKRMVILASKTMFSPSKIWDRNVFIKNLNIMILQIVRNDSLRLGGYVNIKASYKIVQLEV